MNLLAAMLSSLLVGIFIGTLHTPNARRYWQWRLGRKLQLIAERNEMKGYRHKRKRPMLSRWQKCLLGWLHNITPTFTRYTHFRPERLVGWHRRFVKRWWWMRATPNPSSDWVAQQIRDACPFDEAPKRMMMDHDSIFLPLVHTTLPNMGIKVVRTGVGCPWQNGVVERFNRTLTEELLNHIIPISAQHINRLLNNTRPSTTRHGHVGPTRGNRRFGNKTRPTMWLLRRAHCGLRPFRACWCCG